VYPRSRNNWASRLGAGPGTRLNARVGSALVDVVGVAREFWRLVRQWWQVDRIRVSPRQGRLLRIEPPAIIRVDAMIAQVLSRSTGCNGAGPYVAYECRTERGRAQLRICPVGLACQQVSWVEEGQAREVTEDAIEIYGQAGEL
jgi:hypothetical protein